MTRNGGAVRSALTAAKAVVACFALVVAIAGVAAGSASANGGVVSWGWAAHGELGNGIPEEDYAHGCECEDVPTEAILRSLPAGVSVTGISNGELDTYAVLSNGKVMVWGEGTLGNGGLIEETDFPHEVRGLTGVKEVSAAGNHAVALLDTGKVMAWGNNVGGEAGTGSAESYVLSPVEVSGISEVTSVSAGQEDVMAVLSNGTVMTWGFGYLGNGKVFAEEARTPVQVKGLTEVTSISTGSEDTLATLRSGKAVAWGLNADGQLGLGTKTGPEHCTNGPCSTVPVEIPGLSGVKAVSSSASLGGDSMALLSDGKVYDWGSGAVETLGNGTAERSDVPVEVSGLAGATAISGDDRDNLALLADGSVMIWGANSLGRLGDGTEGTPTGVQGVPVEVSGIKGATAIASGWYHSTVLLGTPVVVTESASAVTRTSATLNATVNPDGREVTGCRLEYGISDSYGSSAPCSPSPGAGSSPVSVSAPATGLTAGTTYHFRVVANNLAGTSEGYDQTFTTQPEPPIVATGAASGIGFTSAVLGASVNPNGGEVGVCELEYGTSALYGSSVPCSPSPGAGSSPVSVSALVTGLAADTIYHFRIVATNAGGTSDGADETFATYAYLAPSVITGAATSVTWNFASLGGSVDPNGAEVTECRFEYGLSPAYGFSEACSPPPGSGSSPVSVSAAATGLTGSTTYHFRVVATNPGGTSDGADQTFTTARGPVPTITKLSAKKGPAAGGTPVTITGTNFSGATAVRFGSTNASFKVLSATSITTESPAETPGLVEVTVTTPVGTSAATTKDHFTFGSPTVTNVSPDSGTTAGGTAVTITGTGFAPGDSTVFSFGKLAGTSVHCDSTTECTVVAPAAAKGKSGRVDVTATSGGKKSKKSPPGDQFEYT